MAIQSAIFTFSLPDDVDTDQLLIFESATENGVFVLANTAAYEYGEATYEFDTLDDTKWYKIQFNNSTASETGPLSAAIYGGSFINGQPFLAVSSTYDGANYATIADVYDHSGLNTTEASAAEVSKALKYARSIIDYRTSEMELTRYNLFSEEVARRKYNATLHMIKLAEINIALGQLYRSLSDDQILNSVRNDGGADNNISIGSTSISGGLLAVRPENIAYLAALADKYTSVGAAILNSLVPSSIRLSFTDPSRPSSPKFRYPYRGY
jgi:hypothetical protein